MNNSREAFTNYIKNIENTQVNKNSRQQKYNETLRNLPVSAFGEDRVRIIPIPLKVEVKMLPELNENQLHHNF